MARRIVNRMEKRAEYEAYERRQDEDDVEEGEEGEGEEEEEEKEKDEDDGEVTDAEDDEEVEAPKKKPAKAAKAPKAPKAKAKAKPRSRSPKVAPRMKVVWGVFNNSNQRVATFEYREEKEARAHAEKLKADKNQTFFVQPVKEAMEEKKEKE